MLFLYKNVYILLWFFGITGKEGLLITWLACGFILFVCFSFILSLSLWHDLCVPLTYLQSLSYDKAVWLKEGTLDAHYGIEGIYLREHRSPHSQLEEMSRGQRKGHKQSHLKRKSLDNKKAFCWQKWSRPCVIISYPKHEANLTRLPIDL